MQDSANTFHEPLAGLKPKDWLEKLARITQRHGVFQPLGRRHFSAFIENRDTLLVTFETMQGIRAGEEDAQPIGWDMVKSVGWSCLSLVSHGPTWFRDPNVYLYFDSLTDEGFFDEFEQVVFYGAGPCGYAAAAFSVAAPGATVIAVQPQATLDPEITSWDKRYMSARALDFRTRYGFAPDMIDAANDAYVVFDPTAPLDAMHAALFTRPNVTKLPMRFMGGDLQRHLIDMQLIYRLMGKAGAGKLNRESFSRLLRARRNHAPYLHNLLASVDRANRPALTEALCRNVTSRMQAPKFARRLRELTRPPEPTHKIGPAAAAAAALAPLRLRSGTSGPRQTRVVPQAHDQLSNNAP